MDTPTKQSNAFFSNELHQLLKKALILESQGKRNEAIDTYLKGIELDGSIPEFYHNLANLLQALESYNRALQVEPEYVQSYIGCSNVFAQLGQYKEAIAFCEFALKLKSDYLPAHFNLMNHYRAEEKLELARLQCEKVLQLCPDFLHARLLNMLLTLPRHYESVKDQERARFQYEVELTALEKDFDQLIVSSNPTALEVMSSCYPFFLPYQGKNDRVLQMRFAHLLTRLTQKHYGDRLKPLSMPPVNDRLRIGFISGFFSDHSVWKIPLGGWIEGLDKNRFETFAYATKKAKEAYLNQAEHAFEDTSIEQLAEIILQHQLHVLIFSEIGMDPKSLSLASMRLAPIQVTGLGHPQTTGLSTIDYFLSSELMEIPQSQINYSETLVCLSGLGLNYLSAPASHEPLGPLEDFLEEGRIHYLSSQSLFKYLPSYDYLWPAIAKKVPRAQFIFTSSPLELADLFFERLRKAFEQEGLDYEKFVVRLPRVTQNQFATLCARCDLFLDSIGWSGFNSTIEALQHHLPVITLPGNFARERHSMAVLRFLKIEETIASSLDDYLSIAIELGTNKKKREKLKQKIEKNLPRIYRDREALASLESFLIQSVNEKLQEERCDPSSST